MYLTQKLPDLVRTVEEGPGSQGEEPQAEPESDYFNYEIGAAVVIDGAWSIPEDVAAGTVEISLLSPLPWDGSPLRGVALYVRSSDGSVLFRAHPRLQEILARNSTITARWVRLSSLPDAYGDAAVFREHLRVTLDLPPERGLLNPSSANAMEVVAAVFPEEHAWPDQRGDGWVFVVSQRTRKGKRPRTRHYFSRAERGGPGDVASRVPNTSLMSDMRVAVFGLGAVGGPIAQELNRVGLEGLHINDPDRVDPGTSSRTPYGVFQAGIPKPVALGQTVSAHVPFTEVKASAHRVGAVRPADAPHELTVLNEILDGVDLVIDATAEIGVQMALSRICSERGIPFLLVSATPGAWGGTVAKFLPESTEACAMCWVWARESDVNVKPASAPEEGFQPPGCADPTFTGAGYDGRDLNAGRPYGLRHPSGQATPVERGDLQFARP